MSRAIVFSGDKTWEEREFAEPDPPTDGAVLRVEATGLCHSDVDHFRGNIHTSWEVPSRPSPATRSWAVSTRFGRLPPPNGVSTRATGSLCANC